jgi:hypothetical protein
MPAVNLFFNDEKYVEQLEKITPALKQFVADQLTCKDISLGPGEVSVRLLPALGKGMLAHVELDIFAAPYQERIEKQDEICLNVRQFILDHLDGLKDAKAWIILSELGHSWD